MTSPAFNNETATRLLTDMFDTAVASAQPEVRIPEFLSKIDPSGRLVVIGAGKASAAMARTVEQHWHGGTLSGIVVTRYGYEEPCSQIEIISAAHPVPDNAGHIAAQRILSSVSGLDESDTVLCLISGGGSALLPFPAAGLTLEDKQRINKDLLRSGATIREMNCVRRHLSQIKGGRLAAACYPARLINLLISDVPGDDPADIASGPTVGDSTTCADALEIIDRYQISLLDTVRAQLRSGSDALESIKPDDQRLSRVTTHMIATPYMALQTAAEVAQRAGVATHILGDAIEGEAKEVGTTFAGITQQILAHNTPFQKPCILLSGGETTVTVRGNGKGGRNVEFLLALGIALHGARGVYALAADTDGVDGMAEIAGAVLTPDTLQRAWSLGLSARDALSNNDAHTFFDALGQSLITGPTRTNVNDFRAILISE